LVGQVDQSCCRHGSAVNHGFQVIGLGKTVLYIKVTGELGHVGKALGSAKIVSQEFSNGGNLMQQINIHQLSVGEIDGQVSIQAARNVVRRRGAGGRSECGIHV